METFSSGHRVEVTLVHWPGYTMLETAGKSDPKLHFYKWLKQHNLEYIRSL